MKSLFTIHAGEYLVASHIEQHYKRVNVWIPSRDTGVDLLFPILAPGEPFLFKTRKETLYSGYAPRRVP